MSTSHIDDLLYQPIAEPAPSRLYPYGVADFVGVQIGLMAPFGAIVCSINEMTHAVEVWCRVQGVSNQFWVMPGAATDCIIEFIRKATTEEIAFATAQGMRMAV